MKSKTVNVFMTLFIALFIFDFAGVDAASARECPLQVTPLPENLQIEPLDPSVSPDIAQFHGVWSNGSWGDGSLCTTIVVTKIAVDGNAKIVYSIGGSSDPQPEFWEKEVQIRNGKFSFWLRTNKLTFELGEDGNVKGAYQSSRGGQWKVTLEKIEAVQQTSK